MGKDGAFGPEFRFYGCREKKSHKAFSFIAKLEMFKYRDPQTYKRLSKEKIRIRNFVLASLKKCFFFQNTSHSWHKSKPNALPN